MSAANLLSSGEIIKTLKERCNAGRNRHVWRKQFSARVQREHETIDDWLCDLRSISSKCEFGADCCAACEPTRILGQLVFGVRSDDNSKALLKLGAGLQLDTAVTTLRLSESATRQSTTLRSQSALSVNMTARSTYKKNKFKPM